MKSIFQGFQGPAYWLLSFRCSGSPAISDNAADLTLKGNVGGRVGGGGNSIYCRNCKIF